MRLPSGHHWLSLKLVNREKHPIATSVSCSEESKEKITLLKNLTETVHSSLLSRGRNKII